MKLTRRAALRTLALSTGAMAFAHAQPAPPATETDAVFKLPPLGYDLDALAPYIDAETMKLHHDKHHAAYVSKLNQAVAKLPNKAGKTVEELLGALASLPVELRDDVRNNGGGHANHSLFWQILKKNDGAKPGGSLAAALQSTFGGYDEFWKRFSASAVSLFGSGWTWLAWRDRKLVVETTADQDTPLITGGVPLIGLDLWEHAYYLGYQNRRVDYVAAFEKVINWELVGGRFAKLAS